MCSSDLNGERVRAFMVRLGRFAAASQEDREFAFAQELSTLEGEELVNFCIHYTAMQEELAKGKTAKEEAAAKKR